MRALARHRSAQPSDRVAGVAARATDHPASAPPAPRARRHAYDFAQVNVFPPPRGYALEVDAPEAEELHEAAPGAFAGQVSAATAPVEPAAPPPVTAPGRAACVIASATRVNAPDGTPATRTKVAIGEDVELTTGAAADWTASEGTPASAPATDPFVWRAPEVPATVTITASTGAPATTCSATFTVVGASSLRFTKFSEDAFAAGAQGAGMRCFVDMEPMDVSFRNVEWFEVPGPATGVRGYWLEKENAGADLSHHPNKNWVRMNLGNRAADHASSFDWPPPWKDGGYEWSILNRYRAVGSVLSHFVSRTLQTFDITPDGTTTVTKEGERVKRTP